MRNRTIVFLILILGIIFLLPNYLKAEACDELRSKEYVKQLLFGNNAGKYASDDRTKLLFDAIFICCEQKDNDGQSKLDNIIKKGISGASTLDDVNVKSGKLDKCSHKAWLYEDVSIKDQQKARKTVLKNTVKDIFDFGFFSKIFGSKKIEGFSALIYYFHILSDYMVDNGSETALKGKKIPSFSGNAYNVINNNKPIFNQSQLSQTGTFINYSSLDGYGRAGTAYGRLGPEIEVKPRQQITNIKPAGFKQDKYPNIVNSDPPYLYNRCHLVGHLLGGDDKEYNLITGTRYLNADIMEPRELEIRDYIDKTENHVLYRITPVYNGSHLVASGIQMEAYSIEDSGIGICFNIYCYNIQPGIEIDYSDGKSSVLELNSYDTDKIMFAKYNASETDPDLIFEIDKYLDVIFEDQKNSFSYSSLKNKIKMIANEARNYEWKFKNGEKNKQEYYLNYSGCLSKLYNTLKLYVPELLLKEEFFGNVFP